MSPLNFTHILTQAVDELSESESYKGLFHQHTDGNPLPSAKALCDIIELARAIIFPGYFGNSTVNSRTVTYHIGVNVERLFDLLTEQILAGLCFGSDDEGSSSARKPPQSPPGSSVICPNCAAYWQQMWKPLTTAIQPPIRSVKSSAAIPPFAPSATTV